MKYEEPHSPYTEKYEDEDGSHNFSNNDSRIVPYVPQQKPEWKRYKQYTRSDINAAIECVRNGMSALQASRQFKVPSRTLYDKVKKLGITAGRPMNRTIKRSPSNNGTSAAFPYGISGTRSPYPHNLDNQSLAQSQNEPENGSDMERNERERERDRKHHMPPMITHPAAALLDATFLQQALEARSNEMAGRDALHVMAFAAAAQASLNGMSTSPGTHDTTRSPSPNVLMKYMRPPSPSNNNSGSEQENNCQSSQSPPIRQSNSTQPVAETMSQDDEEDDNHVEDLSMSKKDNERVSRSPSPVPQLGVIVPPMTKVASSNTKDELPPIKIKHEITIDEK